MPSTHTATVREGVYRYNDHDVYVWCGAAYPGEYIYLHHYLRHDPPSPELGTSVTEERLAGFIAWEGWEFLRPHEDDTPPVQQEALPIEQIQIPLDSVSRDALFDSLDIRTALTRASTQEEWLAVRDEYQEALSGLNVEVPVGGYDIPPLQRRSALGMVNVAYVSLEVANALVGTASRGRLTLAPSEQTTSRYHLKPNTDLEYRAWRAFEVSDLWYDHYAGDDERVFEVRQLSRTMRQYRLFRAEYRTQLIREALRQNYIRPQDAMPPTINLAKFDEYLKGVRTNLVRQDNPFSLMTLLPRKVVASRPWGIEIEAVDIEGVDTPKGWTLHDDGSLRPVIRERDVSEGAEFEHDLYCATNERPGCAIDYPDEDHSDCVNDCDCAYSGSEEDYTETGEWGSPPLSSYHSRGLEYLCSKLEHRETNDTPGIHVHVEASDLTPTQAAKVAVIYTLFEPLFEREYHRNTRRYCESLDYGALAERLESMRMAKREGRGADTVTFRQRYHTVNLNALSAHGTIEFRAMGPKYNYEHLVKWASFCREMVNIAKANVPQKVLRKVKTFADLLVVFSQYGKETVTPEWAPVKPEKDRTEQLETENRRLPNIQRKGDVEYTFEDYTQAEPLVAPVRIGW